MTGRGFITQLQGYGLTTAEIHFYRPDAPSILHRTYLTADGSKASVISPRRLMSGTVAKGAAIRLAPAGEALGIAEGIETALSASALFGVPCWAAVNAGMRQSTTATVPANRHRSGGVERFMTHQPSA